MQCPDCKQLRHHGECDPVYEDEPDTLELLAMDAIAARKRYFDAKRAAEGRSTNGVNYEHRS